MKAIKIKIFAALSVASSLILMTASDTGHAGVRAEKGKVDWDSRFILKEKESPEACEAIAPDQDEESCGRWYSAEAAEIVVIKNIHFEFDKSRLRAADKPILKKYAGVMKDRPKSRIRIIGYADAVGTPEFNEQLSKDRAKAITRFLVAQGISPDRIMMEGRGETEPVASNKTDKGRRENRRVEVQFLGVPTKLYGQNLKVLYVP